MKGATDFIHEAGLLKRVKRSGWWLIGIDQPESVADHSYRAALIGYLLGKMEGADAMKVSFMALIQDLPETRLTDIHKIGQRYLDSKPAEKRCFAEQVDRLPPETGTELRALFDEYHTDGSAEGILARDADLLECAFQAKEHIENGHDATDWLNNTKPLLRSESAQDLFSQMMSSSSQDWWKGLKKIGR